MSNAARDIRAVLQDAVVPVGTSRYGVVIGIEQYGDSRLNLRCAKADAEAMRDLMIDPDCGMFAPEDVTCLINEFATKEAIWSALASLRRKAGKDDTVWIYYAGHGAFEGADFFWVPADANVDDLYSTGLSQRQVNQVFADLGAERVMVLLDCCYAAATAAQRHPTRAAATDKEILQGYTGKGRVVLSASDLRERSVELTEEGHGAFTHFLVKGLRGEADDVRSGVVHLDGLWRFLEGKVSEAARRVGHPQNPRLSGEISHRLALSLNPLEVSHRRAIAHKVQELVGLGGDRLTTEEASLCLQVLRHGATTDAQRGIAAEFDGLVAGTTSVETFRRLVQAALQAGPTVPRKAAEPATPSAPPTDTGPSSTAGLSALLAEVRSRHALSEAQALRAIDAWSLDHPEYLNPLSQHADLVDLENVGAFLVGITTLVESREAGVRLESFRGEVTSVATETPAGLWDAPIAVPFGFSGGECEWTAPKPLRIRTCGDCGGKGNHLCKACKGSGTWVCEHCMGTGQERCKACRETGKLLCARCEGTGKEPKGEAGSGSRGGFTGDRCWSCHGEKVRICPKCKGHPLLVCPECVGRPEQSCPDCMGTKQTDCSTCVTAGSVAEFSEVTVRFTSADTDFAIWESPVQDSQIQESLKLATSVPLVDWSTETGSLPSDVDGLPRPVAAQIRQKWHGFLATQNGRVRRTRIVVGYLPYTICRMTHDRAPFDAVVGGIERGVCVSSTAPEDRVYLMGKQAGQSRVERISGIERTLKREETPFITAVVLLWGSIVSAAAMSLYTVLIPDTEPTAAHMELKASFWLGVIGVLMTPAAVFLWRQRVALKKELNQLLRAQQDDPSVHS